jgi:hypothetical protein
MIRTALFALFLAACGGSTANAPSPEPKQEEPPPATDTSEVPKDCDEACTTYGMCWEDVNGGEFSGGGECTSSCNELDEAGKQKYFQCIGQSDCDSVAKC